MQSGSSTASAASLSAAGPALAGLEQGFRNLVGVSGSGSGTASLQGNVQGFINSLQGTALDGNMVSARA